MKLESLKKHILRLSDVVDHQKQATQNDFIGQIQYKMMEAHQKYKQESKSFKQISYGGE